MKKFMTVMFLTTFNLFAHANVKDQQGQMASKIHQQDQIEITTSQWALEKSSNINVLQYAQRTIKNHQHSNIILKKLSEAEEFTLNENFASPRMRELEFLTGEEFDLQYTQFMIDLHADFINEMDHFLLVSYTPSTIESFIHLIYTRVQSGHEKAINLKNLLNSKRL